jgi:hypothetical protein
VVNDLFDDIVFMASLGLPLISTSMADRADYWADRLWFTTCIFDIILLVRDLVTSQNKVHKQQLVLQYLLCKQRETKPQTSRQGMAGSLNHDLPNPDLDLERHVLHTLEEKRFLLVIGLVKLLADLGISRSYALNRPISKTSIACYGLVSAACSIYKLGVKAYAKAKSC